MNHRSERPSSMFRWIVAVLAIAWCSPITTLFAQNDPQHEDDSQILQSTNAPVMPNSTGPYRRVFVRDSDLPLEGYRAMGLESFSELIENRKKRTSSLDPNSPEHDTELRAFHAQVRLQGADLVSERSRLRWNWDSLNQRKREGVRKLLAPWSLAIDKPSRLNTNPAQNLLIPPAWMYDSNGLPLIRVASDEDWFSWTLRPLANSTPNRLNFALAFPRTADSCLVLQLPQSARIADANIVVRQASNWNGVTERIGEWPVALASTDNFPELNATDSFWLLELSGRDQASFSISLNPSRGIYDNLSSDDRSIASWNRLIARQTTVHTVSANYVKTICEWEWVETTTLDRAFRIHVPEGMRLRNLKLNDRETIPRFSDRILELTVPVDETNSNASSNGSTRNRVSAEFLSALPDIASEGVIKVPPIDSLNGYVISGITSIVPDSSIALRNVNGGAGRLETIRNSNKSLDRFEFSWFQSAPEISFAAIEKAAVNSAEILTRLSTETNRAVAFVKIQLSPWHASAPNRIKISSDWALETMQINHRGLGLSLEASNTTGPSTTLRLDPNGPVDDGPVQLELQLSREIDDSFSDNLQTESLIALPERTTTQALVIEPEYASQLEYYGDFYRDLCDEEMLTPWQRDRLPRLGRFLLFRMPDDRLPKLRRKADPTLIECSIATHVSDDENCVRVIHVLEVNPGSTAVSSVGIQLPGIWRWEQESTEGWKAFELKASAESDTWEWIVPAATSSQINNQETQTSPRYRFRAIASLDKNRKPWSLALPRLLTDQPVNYAIHADPVFQVIPDQSRGIWEFDDRGRWMLRWQDPPPNASLLNVTVRNIDQGNRNRWWIPNSHLHLAIDTLGQQRAVLALDAKGLQNQPWEFKLNIPKGWSIERIVDETSEDSAREKRNSFEVSHDGSLHKIHRQPAQPTYEATASEIRIVLAGPRSKPQSFYDYGILSTQAIVFTWPEIYLDSQFPNYAQTLWTPASIFLSGPPTRGLSWEQLTENLPPRSHAIWSAWDWTCEAASWLGWQPSGRDKLSQVSASTAIVAIPPRELIPGWAVKDWKASCCSQGQSVQRSLASETHSLRYAPSRTGTALWLVISLLLAYCLLPRAPWLCLLIVCVSTVGGHWLPDPLAIWFRSTWVGSAIGTFAYLIRWTATTPGFKPTDKDRPEPWHPWNEPGLSGDGLSDASGRAVIISSLGILLSMTIVLPMLAQDIVSTNTQSRETDFDVLIPLDEEGLPSGDVVYVPSSIVSPEEPLPSIASTPDRDSYMISARHSIRFDARSISFGNTEQPCNHIYEVWVGESGVGRPWRIPFSVARSRLSRFLIDGVEVASSRVAKNDSEMVWYPDRIGRRVLQIESQVRIRPAESEKNEPGSVEGVISDPRIQRAWSVDVPILASADATLEIETDAGWSVDFNRRGRFANPSIGKFTIQLGNQDRLVGEIKPDVPYTIAGGGTVAADAGASGSSEPPQMNTELFIDRGQLLARTIVEYPRTVDVPEEIELESDMQWQPVGNLWGDAKLIDIRPGSTLDRRRYIVRLVPDVASSPAKRVITTTWIPVGNTNLRNILFAECRDRRIRTSTLRYARSAGSAWMLEGINTWVPSINIKERIEWLELNERPIATSLKIPVNGGFGVLRQQADNKTQRARVTHQMGIGSTKISLRSRIEFANSMSNRRNLIVSLPAGYSVAEVLSRNNPLSHIQWVVSDRQFVQVFADRESGDVNELTVVAEGNVSDVDTQRIPMPVLALEGVSIAEQFAEFSADPAWRVRFPSHAGQSEFEVMRGKGLGKSLASMNLLESSPSSTVSIQRLKGEWKGNLSVKILSVSEEAMRWELRMVENHSIDAKPVLAVSLPIEMSRGWKSDEVIKELPSLVHNRRWLQIQPAWDDVQQTASFVVEWNAELKTLQDDRWIERLRFESDPQLIVDLADQKENGELSEQTGHKHREYEAGKATVDQFSSGDTPRERLDGFELHQIVPTRPDAERISILSTWWIDRENQVSNGNGDLVWSLPTGTRVHWVSANGQGIYWRRDGDKLLVSFPPIAIPMRIDLWTDSEPSSFTLSSEASTARSFPIRENLPQLGQSTSKVRDGWLIDKGHIYDLEGVRNTKDLGLGGEISRRNMETLKGLRRWQSQSETTDEGSEKTWYCWMDYLMYETESLLLLWTQSDSISDSDDYRATVSSYLELASQMKSKKRGAEPSGPSRTDIRKQLHSSIDAELYRTIAVHQKTDPANSFDKFAWDRLLATLSMALLVVMGPWAWLTFGRPLQRKAWWPLVLIGIGIWVVTGTWIPGLILILLAFVLAVDSYLILNERFRQSGTRAPR